MSAFLTKRPVVTAISYTVLGVFPLYLTAALSVSLQRELGFGRTQFGFVVAAFYLVSAVGSRRLGPFLDRRGAIFGFRLGAITAIVSGLWVGLIAGDWVGMAVGMGLAGAANALGQIASNLVIAKVVGQGRHGIAFAGKQSAAPLGAMIAGLAVPIVNETIEWRVLFFVFAAAGALMFVAAPRFDLEPSSGTARQSTMTAALGVYMVGAGIAGGIGNSFASFVSDASVANGFAESTAARILTLGSLVAVSVRLGAGATADRRQRSGVTEVVTLLAIAMVGLAILAMTGSQTFFLLGAGMAFAGSWGWQGAMFYSVVRLIDLPPATSTGAVAAGVYTGTMLFPPMVGWGAEHYSYPLVFGVAAVAMAVAAGCVAASHRLGRTAQEGRKGQLLS